MTKRSLGTFAIYALLLVAFAAMLLFLWPRSASAQSLEVTPTTQQVVTPDGSTITVPGPGAVKIDGGWTPNNVLLFLGALIPLALSAWAAYQVITAKLIAKSNAERLDRQGATQQQMLRDMPPPPPGGV